MKTWPAKDPNEVLDYVIDWVGTAASPGPLYGGADTIASSTWPTVPAGITKDSDTNDTTTTTIWLSSGTAGDTYILTNRVVTTGGRTMDQSVKLKVKDK